MDNSSSSNDRRQAAQDDHEGSGGEDWLWVESADGDDRSTSAPCTSHTASEVGDGTSACNSPTSETVADMVLTQPLQLPQGPSHAEPQLTQPQTLTTAPPAQPSSPQPQLAVPVDEPKLTRQQQLAAAASAAASAASASLSASTAMCAGFAQQTADAAKREWYNLLLWLDRALASAHTCLQHVSAGACMWLDVIADAACTRLEQASVVAATCVEATQATMQQQLHQTVMFTNRITKGWRAPSWSLVSVGAVATVSVLAVGSLVWRCQGLSTQLRQRDRELAQLVMRIMHLQESLHNSRAAVPVVRHLMQPGGGGFMVSNLA